MRDDRDSTEGVHNYAPLKEYTGPKAHTRRELLIARGYPAHIIEGKEGKS